MSIRAGELKHRMAIQSATQTMSDGGEWTAAWTTISTVWVKFWAKSGQERQTARANQAVVSHGVLMRSFSGLTTAHRLTMGSRSFAITFINDTVPGQLTLDVAEIVGREAM